MENTEQQLALITEMINKARKDFSDNSFIYLLWGWAVSIAALTEYGLMQTDYKNHAIVWLVVLPIAFVAQIVFMTRKQKKEGMKTHMDKIIGTVWIAVGVSSGIVLFSLVVMQFNTYPVLIILYGIGTFISGGIMKLRPMQVGAICCWVIGAVAFYVSFQYQLLLLSLSLILAYIIPGHILQNRFRKQHV